MADFDLRVVLSLIDKFSAPMSKINSQLGEMRKAYRDNGAELRRVGKTMSMYVTAPILAMGGYATKAAIDFEDAFASVEKTVEAPRAVLDKLRKDFENMTRRIPLSFEEFTKIGEAAGQLGIQTEHIAKFTEVMAGLGVATNMSAEEAAIGLARIAVPMQMSQKDFDRMGATLVHLGNNLAATESEIVHMAQRLTPWARTVGMATHEVLAWSAAMTAVGIRAEMGGNALGKVMMKINDEVGTTSEKMKLMARVAEMSVQQFSKLWAEDADKAMQIFVQGLAKADAGGANISRVLDEMGIKEMRAKATLLALAGGINTLNDSLRLGDEGWSKNAALTTETAKRYKTAKSQLIMFKNELRLLAVSFGNIILPGLLAVVKIIKPFVVLLEKLPAPVKRFIAVFLGIIALIGPAMLLIGVIKGIAAALTVGAIPLVIIFAKIALVITAIWTLISVFKALIRFFREHKDNPIIAMFIKLGHVIKTVSLIIVGTHVVMGKEVKKHWGSLVSFLGSIISPIITIVGKIAKAIKAIFFPLGAFIEFITKKIEKFMGWFSKLAGIRKLLKGFSTLEEEGAEAVGKGSKKLKEGGTTLKEKLFPRTLESLEAEDAKRKEKEGKKAREGSRKMLEKYGISEQAATEMGVLGSPVQNYYGGQAGNGNSKHEVMIGLDQGLVTKDVKRKEGNAALGVINTPGYAGNISGSN